jgi:F-type H+-transporting ATPase subunit b
MQQLVSQLGINWQLLLSQAVNFILLLIVLRIFVYKPVLKLLRDRREKIEGGLMKAKEAEKRLHEVDEIGKGKIKEAEFEAVAILKRTEAEAKTVEEKLLAAAKQREEEAIRGAATRLRSQEEESRRALEQEAAALVRLAIARTVELSPEKIDDALIAKAVNEAKHQTA